MKDISLIAFDADDTLWECQTYFEAVEKGYCKLLSGYAPAEDVSKAQLKQQICHSWVMVVRLSYYPSWKMQ